MKIPVILIPFLLALAASIGNAMVTVGQKNASNYSNPFFFGAFSLLFAAVGLFVIAFFYKTEQLYSYAIGNIKWFAMTGVGMLILNVFLYFLYRGYGANSYTLYAILAIITTSIGVSIFYYGEKMNIYYAASLILAIATVLVFIKGKSLDG
ncbi:EamA family transporter [Aureibaculum conchae]|uniref:EamA family transporter n=1 Tax=Aureibaculum sp. 2308TA14-22 TaxID=3108392 RepID=UPI00339A4648